MTGDFTDQTVLITGATSGIGRATALLLASRGAHVIATGRDAHRGDEVVKLITDKGGAATFLAADLSSEAGSEQLVSGLERHAATVDILVNNAGASPMVTNAEVTDALFRQIFQLNVRTPMKLVAALTPGMAARGHGAIVNVTSLAAERGMSIMGLYGASKAALAALTRCWADEFGPAGIRVNAISPALIETEGNAHVAHIHRQNAARSPGRRTGEPNHAAELIAFLAAPGTDHIHGAILPIDGGLSAIA